MDKDDKAVMLLVLIAMSPFLLIIFGGLVVEIIGVLK